MLILYTAMKNPFERINALGEGKVIAIVIILTAITYLALINADPLPDIMEARNLVAARECVDDGNCFVTTMNGVPRVRKPPLPTWVTAATMKLTGSTHNIYSARLPVIFMISLAALFIYLTARRWLDKSLALMAALIAVSFAVMENEARRVTWDIFTTAFAFGGIWALVNAMDPRPWKGAPAENGRSGACSPRGPASPWAWTVLATVLWGLSILSKGPLSVYSIFIPFMAAMALSRERRSYRWWPPAVVIILAALIGSSWWVYMYTAYPEVVVKLATEVDTWTSKRNDSPIYYLLRLPILIFPWALALAGALILPYIKGRDGRAFLSHEKEEQIKFFLIWFAISLILLSLAPQKKYRYLMGALMPASLALAFFIGELRVRGVKGLPPALKIIWGLHKIQLPVAALALLALAVYSAAELGTPTWILLFILPLALLLYYIFKGWRSIGRVALATVFLMFLASFIMGLNARDYLTRGEGKLAEGTYDLAEALKVAEDTCNQTLYAFRDNMRIVWVTGRSNIPIKKDTKLDKLPALVIVRDSDEGAFRDWAASKELTFYEIYRFNYKELYRIYRIKMAANNTEETLKSAEGGII